MTKLSEIEGIGAVYEEKLKAAGIKSIEDLLEKGRTKKDRVNLTEISGVSDKLILEWLNRADLARVKGIGSEYADLLEASGVDTVPELARRSPENLVEKMAQVNEEKKLVRRLPVLSQVESWVAQAKELPRALEY